MILNSASMARSLGFVGLELNRLDGVGVLAAFQRDSS